MASVLLLWYTISATKIQNATVNSVIILGKERNSQHAIFHVYYTVYYTRVSVKNFAETKGSLTCILDAKAYALVSEFDNHNFKIYFKGHFRCLVDQHDEIRNRFCFGNGLKLQGNKSEPQSMLTQYIQRKFASLGHYKTRIVISVWCTGLHEHNTDQLCLCSDKTGVP